MTVLDRISHICGGICLASAFLMAILLSSVDAQTVTSNATGLHTSVTCQANGETWEELGMACHSDRAYRMKPPGDPAGEQSLTHAFACGYAYARNGDHRDCPELKAVEEPHGFK